MGFRFPLLKNEIHLDMKYIYIFLLSLCSAFTYGQNISVTDFRLDEMDLTANQQGTTVLDQNGEKCALIKIFTNETGFTFDVGSLGVAKTEQKTGEIWLYVPHGIRKVTLNHSTFPRVEYALPIPVVKARTYKMELKAERPIVKDEKQTLNIRFTPATATVLVDGDMVETNNGIIAVTLPVGAHTYNIVAKGYVGQSGTVTLTAKAPTTFSVDLQRQKSKPVVLTPKKEEKKPEPTPKADATASVIEGAGEKLSVGGVEFLMVLVENGTFTMGAHKNQMQNIAPQERPAHQVTLTKDYYIGETEVTQDLWYEIMGNNPSYDTGGKKLPVENVSWDDCQEFCKALSERTGRTFRLPTSAEWEFAARGGNKSQGYIYSGSNKADEVGWTEENSGGTIHTVKQKNPNELGLYDMTGNVWEFCQDDFASYRNEKRVDPLDESTDGQKVVRGSSVSYNSRRMARTSFRFYSETYETNNTIGLRIVMEK